VVVEEELAAMMKFDLCHCLILLVHLDDEDDGNGDDDDEDVHDLMRFDQRSCCP